MNERRLVGIDLGVAAKHAVCVLDGGGVRVWKGVAESTRESLAEVERKALAGASEGVRLEVVMEPTGPAWLPVASYFALAGHTVHVPSTVLAHEVRRVLSPNSKANRIDALALARMPLMVPEKVRPWRLPSPAQGTLKRRVRVCARLVRQAAKQKVRIRALVRELLPATPIGVDLTRADLSVLERTGGDPSRLLASRPDRLAKVMATVSRGRLGKERAEEWIGAARVSVSLYGQAMAATLASLGEEVKTEVRLLLALEKELAEHEKAREQAYLQVDPGQLMRSLPGVATVISAVLASFLLGPAQFATGAAFRNYTGLVPKSSQTGDTNRKGQHMSKAGPGLLRTMLVLAADIARQVDPQLARIYYLQMVAKGACHRKALCVVAAHLAERAWAVAHRGTAYVLRDVDGTPITPNEGRTIVALHWRVNEQTRQRTRSKKAMTESRGKAPQQVSVGLGDSAHGATRRPSPTPMLPQPLAAGAGQAMTALAQVLPAVCSKVEAKDRSKRPSPTTGPARLVATAPDPPPRRASAVAHDAGIAQMQAQVRSWKSSAHGQERSPR